MSEEPFKSLENEASYWNKEYQRCFGHPPATPIGGGVRNDIVHGIQSAVQRYYVEKMKKVLGL